MAEQARTLRARITGRVQGVSFRAWCAARAADLGVSGWVRNEPDGSVTALLHGPGAAVSAMIAALHDGPPAARVDDVAVHESHDTPPHGFDVAG